jgi:hypothetical protein
VSSDNAASQTIDWKPWIIFAAGLLLFILGVSRFILSRHFGFGDAMNCGLAIIPAGILLLVFDYVLHHARLVSAIPLFLAGMLIVSSPVFDVALGLTLLAVTSGPLLRDA